MKYFLLIFSVICCFGECYQSKSLNLEELLLFAFCSFIMVSFLLIYYRFIKKTNKSLEKKVSGLPKFLFYLLILIPLLTKFIELFNFGNLFITFDIIVVNFFMALFLFFTLKQEVKRVIFKENLINPIYQSKDILLQSNSIDSKLLSVEQTSSIWVKMVLYFFIIVLVFTPVYKLLGTGYFL